MRDNKMFYDKKFYDVSDNTSRRAAEIILPLVLELFHPKKIIDFGCGEGMWLSVVNKLDKSIRVTGIDGDYIDRNELKISDEDFLPMDLTDKIDLRAKYDLAMSMEVGEHLPSEYAEQFVKNISRHADRVLFSAAIPRQGGTNHINEQWQSYWIKIFQAEGFNTSFALRDYFWRDDEVTPWRRQNLLFFTRYKEDIEKLKDIDVPISDIVHPQMYMLKSNPNIITMQVRDIYERIDSVISRLLNVGMNRIVIYPYGNNGFMCKEILNHKYGIKEMGIVDNRLHEEYENIWSCQDLINVQGEYTVLENSGSSELRMELMEEIIKWIPKKNIINIFENM